MLADITEKQSGEKHGQLCAELYQRAIDLRMPPADIKAAKEQIIAACKAALCVD